MKTNALWLNALLLLVLFLPGGGQLTLAARPEAIYTTMQHPALPEDHAFALTDPTVLAQGSGWTWQNPLPQGNTLNAAWGIGSNDAFAVGDDALFGIAGGFQRVSVAHPDLGAAGVLGQQLAKQLVATHKALSLKSFSLCPN